MKHFINNEDDLFESIANNRLILGEGGDRKC